MKTNLYFITYGLILLVFLSCKQSSDSSLKSDTKLKSDILEEITIFENFYNDINLIHSNDRLGEWGGDYFIVRIYLKEPEREIFADYIEFEGTKIPPPPPPNGESYDFIKNLYRHNTLLTEIKGVKLDYTDKAIVEKAILELAIQRLTNDEEFTYAGFSNSVVFEDSTLIIHDSHTSFIWRSFQELIERLKNK